MAHLASYFDQPNGQPANERVPFHTNDAQNGSNGMSRVPRSASANQDAFYILDDGDEEGEDDGTALDREDERATAEGDDDDLSTTSGPRHGALLQPEMDDWMLLETPYMTHWNHKRHLTGGNPKPRDERDLPDWRMRERLRTVTAALVMCLNIGVDPPDVSKTNPCSKLICWMDPGSLEVSKALPAIGKNLQAQFETLSMKTRYKQYLDPIVEETKRFCTNLRRTAKDERVLFYYNGFGVPKPTPGGEIWVFNKAYTQYIPVTLYDLQAWLGSPCIFVWDASAAGNVVVNFKRLAERKAEEEARAAGRDSKDKDKETRKNGQSEPHFPLRESIHLAACAPDEVLPMNPDLPADLFTCCLTSPIEISLRWFVLQNPLPSALNVDMVMNIPGRLQDRRTPLGELNWIFTAITDTIAWTVLPRTIFRRLFRDDLMVAALLRNFLLAERIMRFYHCTPMSHPQLPPTHNHPLWDSWDLAVDQCLAQLPMLLAKERAQQEAAAGGSPVPPNLAAFEYRHSTFFSEQLKAFEVWLSQGGVSRKGRRRRTGKALTRLLSASSSLKGRFAAEEEEEEDARPVRDPPDQLPIVLQVLLSQVHRLRALILLSQFLDLGPWAVNLALSIGIFPYVLKLLQSPAADLKPVLIYIWARILAVDRSCQNDLLRDSGFVYFVGVLSPFQQSNGAGMGGAGAGQAGPNGAGGALPIPNVSEHRAMCAFILSVFCQDFPAGQAACLETDAMDSCLEHLEDDDFLLRQWGALCLAQLWDDSDDGKARGIRKDAHGKLCCMLSDVSPEVRAAVLYALGTLLGTSGSSLDDLEFGGTAQPSNGTNRAQPRRRCIGTGSATGLQESRQRSMEIGIAVAMLATKGDCSPMVRKELVIALSPLVREHKGFFVLAAYLYYDQEERKLRRIEHPARGSKADGAEEGAESEEALLARVLSKLVIEEGLDEIDIANVPAFTTIFVAILDMSDDSHPEVASLASTILDFIVALMLDSEVSRATESIIRRLGTDATNRITTPTSTSVAAEGYFALTPRVASTTVDDSSINHAASNGHHGPHPAPHARTASYGGPKRASSLAQTVKTIATLGYSRPSSPTGSSDHDSSGQGYGLGGDRSPSGIVGPSGYAHTASRAPAPHFNIAHYTSPYAQTLGASSPDVVPASTPASPTGGSGSLAHRSASAESLAQIARRQDRRSSAGSGVSANSPITNNSGGVLSNVKVGDALAALIAADLRQFRNRAIVGSEQSAPGASPGHTPMPSPSARSRPNNIGLTIGAGELRETLPLKSRLFAWCSEYYTEPQMKSAESEEPGSIKYNVQTWKRQRNERLVNEAQAEVDHATQTPWTEHAGTLRNGAPPYHMLFHQFESHLVTASEQDTISVWDWENGRLLSRFNNGNPLRTNVTSALFVNEDVDALLLVGSAEGNVRIYRNYSAQDNEAPELASSFRALPDLVRSKRPSGLIVDWQQVTGHLIVGGDSRIVRVWDAHRELYVCDIPTRASSCVTSVSSELEMGHIFVAGFGDGTVGVYDRRNPPEASLVRLWEEHQTWVQNVHLQRRGNRELVSASVDGEVRLWDIRGRSSISKINMSGPLKGNLSSMVVHDRGPIFAAASTPRVTRTGLSPQQICIYHLDQLSSIANAAPIVRQFAPMGSTTQQHALLAPATNTQPSLFTPAMSALAFHPHHPLLAFGGPDSSIELRRSPMPPPPRAGADAPAYTPSDLAPVSEPWGGPPSEADPIDLSHRRGSGQAWTHRFFAG